MFPLFRSILYWAFSTRLNFNIGNQTSPLFRLWLYLILTFFFNLQITIQDISAKTSLHPQDVALTFMLLGLVRKNLQNKFIMAIDWSRVDQHMERVKASLASRTRYVHSGSKYTLLIQYSNGSKLSNQLVGMKQPKTLFDGYFRVLWRLLMVNFEYLLTELRLGWRLMTGQYIVFDIWCKPFL